MGSPRTRRLPSTRHENYWGSELGNARHTKALTTWSSRLMSGPCPMNRTIEHVVSSEYDE